VLTKSLHTITAATNVARFLLTERGPRGSQYRTPTGEYQLAHDALQILGYAVAIATVESSDVTVSRIRANCRQLIDEQRKVRS